MNNDNLALTALYASTEGDHWFHNQNWLSNKPLGQWYGITVNIEGRVVSVHLTFNNLNGIN
jgi:hypothetical protein